MTTDDLVTRPGAWLGEAKGTDVIISSRARLARNVTGTPFPGWANEAARVALCGRVRGAVQDCGLLAGARWFDMGATEAVDREILKERHLVSRELVSAGKGSGLVMAADEGLSVMINEEDHVRVQALRPGLCLEAVWRDADGLDSALEGSLTFAFSPSLGYLTACPSNVGTGLRASVMLHLVGLKLMQEIEPVVNGLDKMGIAVRGLLGEGTDANGDMFQISNQGTLGEAERDILARLAGVVEEVAEHERNARLRLMESRRSYVLDQIGRAFGILQHARILTSGEAIDLLSGLRLGVEFGLVGGVTVARINEIMLLTQPGHLQKMEGRSLNSEERDETRAWAVKKALCRVSIED